MTAGSRPPYNVLFLCTGNSARSVMAECALNRWGKYRFQAYSGGSHPLGHIHPLTLKLLHELRYSTASLRSKSWDEFSRPNSPALDFVFTVCDKAAGEACPIWPGQPMTAHWGVEDPAGYVGPEEKQEALFMKVYMELETRIKLFTSLPLDAIDSMSLQRRLEDIGGTSGEDSRGPSGIMSASGTSSGGAARIELAPSTSQRRSAWSPTG